jgi:cell division protein FtsL
MSPRARRTSSSTWTRSAEASGEQTARFHRESDRRRLRAMAGALGCAAVLVMLVLGVVGLRVQQVRLSYRLDGLRSQRIELEETRSRLRVELATLRSLARIDGKARGELGMVPPAREQVRLAREFEAAGTGLASRAPLTASAEPGMGRAIRRRYRPWGRPLARSR